MPSLSGIVEVVAILGCVSSSAYYLICLWSVGNFVRGRKIASLLDVHAFPPVSILKPLKGTDPAIHEAFRSHCLQDYPEYEIIFGVSDPLDPAAASFQEIQREFPDSRISLVVCPNIHGTNVKVSNLEQMVERARYEHLVVNDSDIRVQPDYLQKVIAPLSDERIGMVTCLYRGVAADTLGSHLERLGISTDFSAGVLVAQHLEGGLRFGLGSTLAFRKKDLGRIGGFKSILDFLADDYELGRRIADLGLKVVLSPIVVETHLPPYDFRGFLQHQMRWARGIRDARPGGYLGLVLTFGVMWSPLLVIASHAAPWSWAAAGAVLLLRFAVAMAVGNSTLLDKRLISQLWLLPVRDLIAVAIWIASFAGHSVEWRGEKFELNNGRLIRIDQK